MDPALILAVVSLGVIHGILPDHGWPIAATYALARPRIWLAGVIAGLVLGIGHLLSSVALVLAYYWFATFAAFAEGPWMQPLAGGLLILLGIREYLAYRHAGHDHHHDHGHGLLHRVSSKLSAHPFDEDVADGGLRMLGGTAILLGFAHEEPIQILAICAGTAWCLQLMLIYSLAVIVAILAPTLVLIAGYRAHRDRIEHYTPYMPLLTATVLVLVGVGFVAGVL